MADKDDIEQLRARIRDLENRLGFPQKLEMSERAAAAAEARKKAQGLPDISAGEDLAKRIIALATQSNVIVEWSASEIYAQMRAQPCCCCCCCCCHCS